MNAISTLFHILVSAVSLYELMCVVYIMMSWFPGARDSKFGWYLGQACEPFLGFFRRIPLRFANIDFSPILAFAALALISGVFSNIADYGTIKLGVLLAALLQVCWSLADSILAFFSIITAIRLVVHLAGKDFSSGVWQMLDNVIRPVKTRVTSLFLGNRYRKYSTELAMTLGMCIIVQVAGSVLIGYIAKLFAALPI